MLSECKTEKLFFEATLSGYFLNDSKFVISNPINGSTIAIINTQSEEDSDLLRRFNHYYDFYKSEIGKDESNRKYLLINRNKGKNLKFTLNFKADSFDTVKASSDYLLAFYLNKDEKYYESSYLPVRIIDIIDPCSQKITTKIFPNFDKIINLQKTYNFKLEIPDVIFTHPFIKKCLEASPEIKYYFFEFLKKILPEDEYMEKRLLWEIQ